MGHKGHRFRTGPLFPADSRQPRESGGDAVRTPLADGSAYEAAMARARQPACSIHVFIFFS